MIDKKTINKNLEVHIEKLINRLERLKKRSRVYSLYRLLLFLTGIIGFLFLFFYVNEISAYLFFILFIVCFGILTNLHNKLDLGIKKNIIWIKIKRELLARSLINWEKLPPPKFPNPDYSHPFDGDLNITGNYSLIHLIDSTVTDEGGKRLRDWFLAGKPTKDLIEQRQNILKELIPLDIFRNKIKLYANLISKKALSGNKLLESLETESDINAIKKILILASILIAAGIILFVLNMFGLIKAYWTIAALIYVGVYFFNQKMVEKLFEKSTEIEEDLGKFTKILSYLELYKYKNNSKLKNLCKPFWQSEENPSKYFKRIRRLVNAAAFQQNPFYELMVNIIFPYDFFVSYKLEKLKIKISERLKTWLDLFYDLEALNSLASFAYLNPDYNFPKINNETDSLLFSTKRIGHPLIPSDKNVHNDFEINKVGEAIIITGSNMSGKSTFLKTIGTNLVLAYAGAPINAEILETNIFRIFSCIKISDSVTDGISYFYAEVKRLKKLLEEIKSPDKIPVFYLIDEIFKGTNNKERLIGSKEYIKAIVNLNSIGLISTHDLELVNLENEIKNILNYHFKEETLDNKMIFNYQLQYGPCPTTNALKIMKAEGLPIKPED